jgi:hypothetical protein
MVVVGNFRNHAELRKKPRRQFHYNASLLLEGARLPVPCAIADISASGARLHIEGDLELPEKFILLLTRSGEARRMCRVVWRNGQDVGVEFPNVQP